MLGVSQSNVRIHTVLYFTKWIEFIPYFVQCTHDIKGRTRCFLGQCQCSTTKCQNDIVFHKVGKIYTLFWLICFLG